MVVLGLYGDPQLAFRDSRTLTERVSYDQEAPGKDFLFLGVLAFVALENGIRAKTQGIRLRGTL
jgi:hypothetical protein